MIRSFKDRETRRFFEGQRVTAFHGFANQAVRRLTLLDSAETLRDLAALSGNRLEHYGATAPVSTAFGSTRSGASAFVGPTTGLAMWRSWTITKGMQA